MSTSLNGETIRQIERNSIFEFLQAHQALLRGKVLDFGCGRQPYRQLVSGAYFAYDVTLWDGVEPASLLDSPAGEAPYDAILFNQVIQYVTYPKIALAIIHELLAPGGYLVMTYPTCWDEVEPTDHCRYTRAGMNTLLAGVGFKVLNHERRASIDFPGFQFPLGYGVVAQRQL